jgi:uncharacterized repeat protein (TIGR03803 family)
MLSKMICSIFALCVASAIASHAQTFTTLASFDGSDGYGPVFVSLVQGVDGNFYGTTEYGGTSNGGTVFKVTPAGKVTTLHSFGITDGSSPFAGLVLGSNRKFYGTTSTGGTNGDGTVFAITAAGKLTVLHSFTGADGGFPAAVLVQATNGKFYGTTLSGGANADGTVFTMTPAGKLSTLYAFAGADGAGPEGGVVQDAKGNFYGTTRYGGAKGGSCSDVAGCGTVFEITASGKLTTLYSFCAQAGCPEGSFPSAGLVQATNGNFYGTTSTGGVNGNGTVFEISAGGTLNTLYSFCSQAGCADGSSPEAGLIGAANGNFYGTTGSGGAHYEGTIFEITAGGTLTNLYSFCPQMSCPDGATPTGGLAQGTDGGLYGTTDQGGSEDCAAGCGTVFSLSVGLGPFVQTNPISGKVGAEVVILGNNLKGATSVTFNGTPATFKASKTDITTKVPAGATTGTVVVTTPNGTLTSNAPFQVSQ